MQKLVDLFFEDTTVTLFDELLNESDVMRAYRWWLRSHCAVVQALADQGPLRGVKAGNETAAEDILAATDSGR